MALYADTTLLGIDPHRSFFPALNGELIYRNEPTDIDMD